MRKQIGSMTSKGRITIPAEIRAALGLDPGDVVQFRLDGDRIIVEPVESELLGAYRSIPALDPSMTDRELQEAFEQEVADEAAGGL